MKDNRQKKATEDAEAIPHGNPPHEKTIREEINESPLAPFDPRLKKPGDGRLQSNKDPLNGVNE